LPYRAGSSPANTSRWRSRESCLILILILTLILILILTLILILIPL
jgi:hypothetical protein